MKFGPFKASFYACQQHVIGMEVCLSVCLSVTRWDCIKTVYRRITGFSPHDSPRIIVSENPNMSKNSKGSPPVNPVNGVGEKIL